MGKEKQRQPIHIKIGESVFACVSGAGVGAGVGMVLTGSSGAGLPIALLSGWVATEGAIRVSSRVAATRLKEKMRLDRQNKGLPDLE